VTLKNNTKEMRGQLEFVLLSPTLAWSTPLGLPAPTFNKWHKKKKTLHMLTHVTMRGRGLTSSVTKFMIQGRESDNKE